MGKLPKTVWIAVLGALLFLPMLGSYGLWDPDELKYADVARDLAEGRGNADTTKRSIHGPQAPLQTWIVAGGFKIMGVNELAGRLPIALLGILGLVLACYFVSRMVSPKAGLAAGFVLATTPLFLFQSRQLISEIPLYVALIASVGGLAAFVWPADGNSRRRDLVIGCLGLVAGTLSRSFVVGTAYPLIVVWTAIWGSRNLTRNAPAASADDPSYRESADQQGDPGESLGAAVRRHRKQLMIGCGVALAVAVAFVFAFDSKMIMLFGAGYRKVTHPPTFDVAIRELGFGFFPWIALLPAALAGFMAGLRQQEGQTADRLFFFKLIVLATVAMGYLLTVLQPLAFAKTRFIGLPWLAIMVGVWAQQAWQERSTKPLWGFTAAALILILHQDFVANPQQLAFAHLMGEPKFPDGITVRTSFRVFGGLLALGFFFALNGVPKPQRPNWRGRFGKMLNWLMVFFEWIGAGLAFLGRWFGKVAGPEQRNVWAFCGIVTLGFAVWSGFYLTGEVSYHMSNKALFKTFSRCKQGDQKLFQFRVPNRGAGYYVDGKVESIKTQGQLLTQLKQPKRLFVLVPTSQIASIDQAARKQQVKYHVLDDRNSKYYIISNKLEGSCTEDLNPIRKWVRSEAPKPKYKAYANFEDKIELIGYDAPDKAKIGRHLKITFYFKVKAKLPPNYKLFIHFDKPASRFHGDHKPLDGKYPTQYWLPGDYIADTYEIELPVLTTMPGNYTINMGFWLGSKRLKVIKGRTNGKNRVLAGRLSVGYL